MPNIHSYRTEHAKSLVNVSDDARGMTPLHFACSDNNKELVEKLLKAEAHPEARYCFLFCMFCCKQLDIMLIDQYS